MRPASPSLRDWPAAAAVVVVVVIAAVRVAIGVARLVNDDADVIAAPRTERELKRRDVREVHWRAKAGPVDLQHHMGWEGNEE